MAQVIVTKHFGPTNTKGSRIQVKSWLKTSYVSWDYSFTLEQNHAKAVEEVLHEMNKERSSFDCAAAWTVVGSGSMPDGSGYGFVVE
ncbi:hypothetical protein vB_PsyM_KIL3b_0157 [Pseudomonas phage vB_PsyM_KIL3b]|uniref:Uncharacterized protein n=4 Tax=Pseudomonas phage vB_PsyM_KIL1 TaxID=1777065 RepID=A0A142IEA7_9CAUD|nr:hypothetical protein BH774_gp047 [Pseudomonas phage vB_PsyM_KIL1]AMR57402.1 hypothetical protein vB_PsyM_KIL1_0155 [Pseudomonas phage vB_PsyM_KIL1]AMR57562.1 hypothetical protein vB_PsyM_KIL2_0162 [Pseudomonas phage vB_PsyM_KIL2]AMR57724.1 hypothetical protein vB_PsyM_KIL3_0157 [Pseudomonas phage vB_PsyM_KIL3]AMR58222.1 hypothetical protein vB_PsyM_KIL3b_0157 [Pseudomonas phage vB_PsyM_KIL3b]